MLDAMKRILSTIVSRFAYCNPHECEILGTRDDGVTYDVRTEAFGTVHNARICVGLPDTRIILVSGSKAWLTFDQGKPDRPLIFGFNQDTVASSIKIGGLSAATVVKTTDIMSFDGTIAGQAAKGTVTVTGGTSKVRLA